MTSNKCPIITKQVVVVFMTSLVTIVTVQPVKDTLNFPFKCFKLENEHDEPHNFFRLLNNDQDDKIHLFVKLQISTFLPSGFRATLNFRKLH